ncbi:MAG: FAD-dependent oxidoreductase [Hyphomicrobiaceae bacterium]
MAIEEVDVAIIGGGPAGISAARELQRLGLRRVVVLEREREAGGTVRHCGHRGFGMLDFGRVWTGPRYAERLRRVSRGLDVRPSTAVLALGTEGQLALSTPEGPREIRAERVLLATGIREATRAARLVSGGRPFGILTTGALQRFVYLEGRLPCRRPVVIGSELVAYSTILTLRHAGVRPVALLEEESQTAAPFPVSHLARLLFGVRTERSARLTAIEGEAQVTAITIERQGRLERLACDGVIFTGKWVPEATLMRQHPAGVDPATAGPRVDHNLRTADPRIFAAGNVRYGVRSSGRCALEGRYAARAIARDLMQTR